MEKIENNQLHLTRFHVGTMERWKVLRCRWYSVRLSLSRLPKCTLKGNVPAGSANCIIWRVCSANSSGRRLGWCSWLLGIIFYSLAAVINWYKPRSPHGKVPVCENMPFLIDLAAEQLWLQEQNYCSLVSYVIFISGPESGKESPGKVNWVKCSITIINNQRENSVETL